MLLKRKGLTIERPQRGQGIVTALLAAALALALAIALAVRAADWPIAWPTLLAYLAAIALFLLALLFAFWAYACSTLHYRLDPGGLLIRWGPVRHFIPIDRIEKLILGRGEDQPQLLGLSWWGHHVGRGVVQGLGEVLFFSTHRSPEEVIYVQTATATYGLSPQDPMRFSLEVKRFKEAGRPRGSETVRRHPLAAHPLWTDRIAQGLAATAIALNVGLFAYIFAIYPGLSDPITIAFPPVGDITTLEAKREILRIPATALALLAVNLVGAVAFQWRERAATYLLLSGAVFLQLLFWVAAAIAVANA